ncbi:hypothetical protein C8Q74DRAFT_1445892 [Fomes fomentarius]|nr:hypothetical protein C8Q74DRAFT_1445892 [Fomes fomentarius]
MAQPQPTKRQPLNMRRDVLFAPSDGKTYKYPEDEERVFAQQPIEGPVLPARYLLPSPTAALQPPVLRFGWRLGHDKLMDLVRRHFPNSIERCPGPPNAALLDDLDEDAIELDYPPDELNDNIFQTISGPGFAVEICELLAIPSKWEAMVGVMPLYDSQLNSEFGLTIGTNYLGIPDADKIAELQRLIDTVEPDARPMWYLDHIDWRWRRVVPPQHKSTRKVVRNQGVEFTSPSVAPVCVL